MNQTKLAIYVNVIVGLGWNPWQWVGQLLLTQATTLTFPAVSLDNNFCSVPFSSLQFLFTHVWWLGPLWRNLWRVRHSVSLQRNKFMAASFRNCRFCTVVRFAKFIYFNYNLFKYTVESNVGISRFKPVITYIVRWNLCRVTILLYTFMERKLLELFLFTPWREHAKFSAKQVFV